MTTYKDILENIYYTASNPNAFRSVRKLYSAAKQQIPNLKFKNVKDWLSGELTYTLHKQARRNFSREKIFVTQEFEQYQADLVDMVKYYRTNNNYRYILTVIDCFSRFAFAIPVKNKKGESIRDALKIIFKENKPEKLQTDRGSEFLNEPVQSYLKKEEISFFTAHNTKFKCAIVERFNRTLQSIMYKYFTAKGTTKYIDVLQTLVDSYNNSVHRTLKMSPISVDERNTAQVFKNIYGVSSPREYIMLKNKIPKLSVGDKVRKKYELTHMDKGYYPNWTDELYTITKAIKGVTKPMYNIQSYDRTVLPQKLYPEEIQKVKENLYRIESIVRPERRNGVKGFIVKWLNYSSEHNSWVPESEIVRLNERRSI
jgi:hypothetical protein